MSEFISSKVPSVLFFLTIFLWSCSGNPNQSPTTPVVQSASMTPNLPTVSYTNTPLPSPTYTSSPANTATPISTLAPTITASITPSPTITPLVIPENAIMFFFTQLNTGGSVACGDSLVKIYSGHVRTGNIEEDIRIALDSLFSNGKYFGNLYNAVYPSNFRVQSVDFHQSTGKAVIILGGNYVRPENYCDSRRYREQIWATARRFPEVNRITIFLSNGILLGDLLAVFTDS